MVTLVDGEGADARKSEVTLETAVLTLFDHFDRLAIAKTPFALRVEFPLCDEVVRVHARGTLRAAVVWLLTKEGAHRDDARQRRPEFRGSRVHQFAPAPQTSLYFFKMHRNGRLQRTAADDRVCATGRRRPHARGGSARGQQMRRDGNDYGERFDDDPICMQEVLECFCVCLSPRVTGVHRKV